MIKRENAHVNRKSVVIFSTILTGVKWPKYGKIVEKTMKKRSHFCSFFRKRQNIVNVVVITTF
jgi:hypothetical protein